MIELTFILLEPQTPVSKAEGSLQSVKDLSMIGDVNLFLPDGPTGEIECEVMLAGELSKETAMHDAQCVLFPH